jgi:hydrogenase 3 maturation protease
LKARRKSKTETGRKSGKPAPSAAKPSALNDFQGLTAKLRENLTGYARLGVLGIGSDLRSDDAAGILICRELQKWNSKNPSKQMGVFIGETAPENLTGEIRAFTPSHLIIIDIFQSDLRPGTIRIFEPRNVAEGVSFSTHKMPVRVLTDFLEQTIHCKVVIIGIQAKSIVFNGKISPAVQDAVKEVVSLISGIAGK